MDEIMAHFDNFPCFRHVCVGQYLTGDEVYIVFYRDGIMECLCIYDIHHDAIYSKLSYIFYCKFKVFVLRQFFD
ncbi:hypothetical protein D3C78_1820860 [compost metagenome]